MKLLPSLPLDQIGHAPSGPKRGVITQRLRTCFQSLAQLFQLHLLQTGFAARSRCLNQRLGSLFLPSLMPPAYRLAVNAQLPSDFPLMETPVKKPRGFKPSPFQLFKITLDAFWISHAQILARRTDCVTILCDTQ